MPRAALIKQVPNERVHSSSNCTPQIGDIVQIDQSFTFEDGKAGCLVYGFSSNGEFTYSAEVYESELGENIEPNA